MGTRNKVETWNRKAREGKRQTVLLVSECQEVGTVAGMFPGVMDDRGSVVAASLCFVHCAEARSMTALSGSFLRAERIVGRLRARCGIEEVRDRGAGPDRTEWRTRPPGWCDAGGAYVHPRTSSWARPRPTADGSPEPAVAHVPS